MADFKTAYQLTASNEGGYSNNRTDQGGETYKGISRKAWPAWGGWEIIDQMKKGAGFPGNLEQFVTLQQMVRDFYKQVFWDTLKLDSVNNQVVANELYDTAVNMGVKTAAVFLQRVLNVANKNGTYYSDLKADGAIGSVTLSALNDHPYPDVIAKGINCLQGAKYINLAEANKSQEAFINGWFLNRI